MSNDELGQALIYPYYTVRSSAGNQFNTYFSIANQSESAKAVRIRLREGRNSQVVANFNLFLAPRDVWAGAVVPTALGARLITSDRSCVSPQFGGQPLGLEFSNSSYVGDGKGDDLDRAREGWIEAIEMGTLTGASANAVSQVSAIGAAIPNDCAAVQGTALLQTASPTGGLSGSLTIINVANGLNFSVVPTALDDLAVAPFYRPASDPYPGFDSNEVQSISSVVHGGFLYRSNWSRGVDAVSAVLMRSSWAGEVNVEPTTSSSTDFVVVFPTRQHYVSPGAALAPFTADCGRRNDTFAGEVVDVQAFDREQAGGSIVGFEPFPLTSSWRCGAASVVDFHGSFPHSAFGDATSVLGSTNRGMAAVGMVPVRGTNGWARLRALSPRSLDSLGSSQRIEIATGQTTGGSHRYLGLPVIGASFSTLFNGTLSCSTGSCLGSYGISGPLAYTRTIN